MAMLSLLARSSAFSPLSLSPALWLKADGVLWQDSARTTLATADGDPVGAWDDASGNGRHATQAVAAKRLTYKTAIQNGLSVVRGDGTDDFLAFAALTYGASWTLFLVCKNGSGADYIVSGSGGGDSPAIITGFGGVSFEYYNDGGDRATLDAASTGIHVLAVRWDDAANRTGYFNGAQVFSAATTVSHATNTAANLGATVGGTDTYGGDICELLIYPTALSDANVTAVNAYLKAKWGTP